MFAVSVAERTVWATREEHRARYYSLNFEIEGHRVKGPRLIEAAEAIHEPIWGFRKFEVLVGSLYIYNKGCSIVSPHWGPPLEENREIATWG